MVNAVDQTGIAVQAAALTVGRENVNASAAPLAGAEDFAFMLEKKPGAYIMIGNGGTGEGGCQNVHSPLYDFSDEILTTGAAYGSTWCRSSWATRRRNVRQRSLPCHPSLRSG